MCVFLSLDMASMLLLSGIHTYDTIVMLCNVLTNNSYLSLMIFSLSCLLPNLFPLASQSAPFLPLLHCHHCSHRLALTTPPEVLQILGMTAPHLATHERKLHESE